MARNSSAGGSSAAVAASVSAAMLLLLLVAAALPVAVDGTCGHGRGTRWYRRLLIR